MADVLVFFFFQCDVNCRTVVNLPAPGNLRMIEDITLCLSGNAGNPSMTLAKIGVSVEIAGYSGNDMIGESFRRTLAETGVGLDKLRSHPTLGTGIAVGAVLPNGEKSVVFTTGANDETDLFAVPDDWLDGLKVIYVASVFVLPRFTGEAIASLFQRARQRGVTTVLNVCCDADKTRMAFIAPALPYTDFFILNKDEGRLISEQSDPPAMLAVIERAMADSGKVILTLGDQGCMLRDEQGNIRHIPAVPVKAIDTTGAGDTFIAGFIAGLVHRLPLVRCAEMGCQLASYAVTGAGSYQRLPQLASPLDLLTLQGERTHDTR